MEETEQEILKKNIKMNRFKVVTNLILIVILLGIAFYVIKEIELFKTLSQDVCKYCQLKTGAICYTPIR
jgi:SNF family Na+-dependent transporter